MCVVASQPQLAYCETSKKVVYNSSGCIFVLVLLNYAPWLVHVVRSTRTACVCDAHATPSNLVNVRMLIMHVHCIVV